MPETLLRPESLLRIVQIGDLHHGGQQAQSFVDDHDSAFSRELVTLLNPQPIEDNLRAIILAVQNEGCDAVVAMGDVVDKGNKALYSAGLHLLLDALISDNEVKGKTIVLPGNHDINRNDALISIAAKFEHIHAAITDIGLSPVPMDDVRTLSLAHGTSRAALFALNSCIGCGERRLLPERIGRQIEELISSHIRDAAFSATGTTQFPDMLTQYYEQLDTPAFSNDAMNKLQTAALSFNTDSASAFVVAAHHNLLSQAQPRIAPYSELINGGQFRNLLLEFDRPIIYLHGHTHTDPIEIVQQPARDGALLVCISAPELRRGFNIVEILFNQTGAAFGCRVRPYRTADGGKPKEQAPIKIPFYRHVQQAMSQLNGAILNVIFEKQTIYWPDLQTELKSKEYDISDQDLSYAIRELSWNSYLLLHNEEQPIMRWRMSSPL